MPSLNRLTLFLSLSTLSAALGAAEVAVSIKNFAFNTRELTIDQGDAVKWSNDDAPILHTTTSGSPGAQNGLWDKSLGGGATFRRVFRKSGDFPYYCKIHPDMTATIHVRSVEATRIEKGLAIAPVPLSYPQTKRNAVGLGSYIVNAQAGCADCHSCPTYQPGHNPYRGEPAQFNSASYLAGGVAFGADVVSANLTPQAGSGNPAGLTLNRFKQLLRTGQQSPSHILQVMPWPIFGNMSDRDLTAVYEYLRAIPSANGPETPCSGPGQ